MNIDERIARVRAHVEKNKGKERATFSLDGIRALLEAIDARPSPSAAVQALLEVKDAILRADPDVLTDTLWMPDDVLKGATVVDRIDIALSEQADAGAIKLDGPELWEIVFGVNSDAAGEISDEQYEKIAAHINAVFVDPGTAAAALERAAIAVDRAWREEGGLNCTKVCAIVRSALSAQVQDAPEKVGRFGHHPEPAIDFCIEVEALEGHLFDAKHGIGKPGHEPRRIDDEFRRRVSRAMDFIVGGDQIAIAAKATLRSISAQVQDVAGWVFAEGDTVRKKSGSWWEGRVVGTYTTEQTPRGYAVQLDKPFGPVQIYPENALEAAAPAKQEGGR